MLNNLVQKYVLFSLSFFLIGCSSANTSALQNSTVDVSLFQTTSSILNDSKESNMDVDKSEVIRAKANASGIVYDTTVEISLRHTQDEKIEDHASLTEIQNTKGMENYTIQDGKILFENLGEDIEYSGKSTKKLPLETSITYTLNGEEILPEDLAHKSGEVSITYTFKNTTEPFVPFLAMSVIALDESNFSHVEISSGKVMSFEDSLLVLGVSFPQVQDVLDLKNMDFTKEMKEIPSSITLTCETSDFSLDSSSIVFMNGLFKKEDEDEKDSFEEIKENLNKLIDATKELYDGTNTLFDGATTYQEYTGQFHDGLITLKDGSKALKDALNTLNSQKTDLITGIASLETMLVQLDSSFDLLLTSISQEENQNQIQEASSTLLETISILEEGLRKMETDISALESYKSALTSSSDALKQSIADTNSKITSINQEREEKKETILQKIEESNLTSEEKESISSEIAAAFKDTDTLESISVSLPESISLSSTALQLDTAKIQNALNLISANASFSSILKEMKKSTSTLCFLANSLSSGSSSLSDALSGLSKAGDSLYDGTNAILEAHTEMIQGLNELVGGINSLKDGVKEYKEEGIDKFKDLSLLIDNISALQKADTEYAGYTSTLESKTHTSLFLVETDSIK